MSGDPLPKAQLADQFEAAEMWLWEASDDELAELGRTLRAATREFTAPPPDSLFVRKQREFFDEMIAPTWNSLVADRIIARFLEENPSQRAEHVD